MTTDAYTNYGRTFTKGGSAIGKCMIIDFPEIKTNKVESTNHAGGGVREFIPDGLYGLEDVTLSVIVASGVVPAMKTAMAAKTVDACVIVGAKDTVTFSGFYQSIKVENADAVSPDVEKVTVVISPTGGITFS